jgi:pseudaminic acid cytidylyltransferase
LPNLAIIPARGGSKRIPRKNTLDFLGKPVMAYSIELALSSGLFDEVMVSTEDKEIRDLALSFGAQVPFTRSGENADDHATTLDVILEVVDQYRTKENRQFDKVCCIYPTAPLARVEHLQEGYNMLTQKNFDSVFPVVAFSFPVWRGLYRENNGQARMIWPEHQNSRSQDLKSVYHDAGQWYWFIPSRVQNGLYTPNSGTVLLDEMEAQDIDNLVDWKLAELKYKLMHGL